MTSEPPLNGRRPSEVPSGFLRTFSILHCVWFAALLSAWVGLMLSSPFDPDYATGEMLDNLLAWEETGVLYPSLDTSFGPFRVQNYPPLFFAIARFLSFCGLHPLASGRLLDLLAMCATLFLTFRWLRNYGLNTLWALFGISLSSSNVAFLIRPKSTPGSVEGTNPPLDIAKSPR